jgi:hypothetical protein
MTTNTMTTTRIEKAAATPSSSSVIFSRIRTVIRVQLMEIKKIVALMAVMERMKTTPNPAKKAGRIRGRVMRRKVVPDLGSQAKRGFLNAGIDLLKFRNSSLNAYRDISKMKTRIMIAAVPVNTRGG